MQSKTAVYTLRRFPIDRRKKGENPIVNFSHYYNNTKYTPFYSAFLFFCKFFNDDLWISYILVFSKFIFRQILFSFSPNMYLYRSTACSCGSDSSESQFRLFSTFPPPLNILFYIVPVNQSICKSIRIYRLTFRRVAYHWLLPSLYWFATAISVFDIQYSLHFALFFCIPVILFASMICPLFRNRLRFLVFV